MVEYDPFSDELVYGDKYALYAKLREEAPVYYSEKWNCWALSRFDAVWEACQHDAFSVAKGTTLSHLLTKVQPVTPMINMMDPPQHTALRKRLARHFSPKAAQRFEAPILETYAYSSSKAAVHQLTRVLALQLARRHITVNAIAPVPAPFA